MTDAAVSSWIGGIERGLAGQLERKARKRRLAPWQVEALTYCATFERHARKFAALATAAHKAGDTAAALDWAHHAKRCAENVAKINLALTSC